MESTTGYTFTPCVGSFTSPGIDTGQIEGTNGFYCLIRKTERFTISNVESQVFTPNNSRLPRGLNAGGPRPKRVSYHWTTAPLDSHQSPPGRPLPGTFFRRIWAIPAETAGNGKDNV